MTIVYTGGGTSGHRAPLVAVHQALRRVVPDLKAYYIGTSEDVVSLDISALKKNKVRTATIEAGKLRRYWSWQNIKDVGKIWRGFWQARHQLKQWQPDVVFAKGGYVTVPVVRAARSLRIPVVTHESDVVMGLANRLNGQSARVICTAYPVEYYRGMTKNKLHYTGNLIRQELIDAAASKTKSGVFKIGGRTLTADKPLVVIFGGSQGAHRINELIVSLLPQLLPKCRLIHQTGPGDIEWLNQKRLVLSRTEQSSYFPIDFINIELLGSVLKAADVVVSRAGSMVSELALFEVPTILIPLSTSAGGHQLRNAMLFENAKAAKILREESLTANELGAMIERLIKDEPLRKSLAGAMHKLQENSGAKRVAELIVANAR